MKKTILITLISIFAATNYSQACTVDDSYQVVMKNDIIVDVANQYYADLASSTINLENYHHEISWKFSDSGFGCHDTDTIDTTMTINYPHRWDPTVRCEAKVVVHFVNGPKIKGGGHVAEKETTEIYSNCN